MQSGHSKTASRAWLRGERRAGSRAAWPVVVLGLLGHGDGGRPGVVRRDAARRRPGRPCRDTVALLAGFAVLALLRAALSIAAERAAFNAGAAARRRLRTDALSRLLQAGPALLRAQHTGELAAIVVDRIEALDGLSRPLAAGRRAGDRRPAAGGARRAAGRSVGRRLCWFCAACWCRSRWRCRYRRRGRVAQPVPGAGAAAGALPRSRARHRHHRAVRPGGGRGALARRGRGRTAAAHHARAARGVPVLGRARSGGGAGVGRAGAALRRGSCWPAAWRIPATALFVLLLVPEFFAPLRGFAAAYQDRLHATGAAEALVDLPPLPRAAAAARGPHRRRARRHRRVRGRAPDLGSRARAGAGRPVVPRAGRRDPGAGRARRAPANRP